MSTPRLVEYSLESELSKSGLQEYLQEYVCLMECSGDIINSIGWINCGVIIVIFCIIILMYIRYSEHVPNKNLDVLPPSIRKNKYHTSFQQKK